MTAAAAPNQVDDDYFPVSGEVDAQGRLLDLLGIVDSTQAELITPPPRPDWTNPGDPVLTQMEGNAELTARLGFGGFDASSTGSTKYEVLDLLQTKDVASTAAGGPVDAWVYGIGIRLLLRAANASADLSVNYASFAAAASLGLAETSFEFQTIGIGFDALPLLRGLILQAVKGWDAGTTIAFGDAWFQVLTHIATANPATFTPRLVGVRLGSYDALGSVGGSYGFALRAIRKGLDGASALTQTASFPPGSSLSAQIVTDVYDAVVGSMNVGPADTMIATAADLDDSGP